MKGSGFRRARKERALAIALALVGITATALALLCAVESAWGAAVAYAMPGISSLLAWRWWLHVTPLHGGFHGRPMWLGPLDEFVKLFDDGAEPFARWGTTAGQRIEVRVMHDDIETAFE